MEEKILLKSYSLINDNSIRISELPDKMQTKFQMIDDLLSQYDNAQSDQEEKDIKAKIIAYDNGLENDLESYIVQIQSNKEDEPNELLGAESESKQAEQNESSETKPTWRFWM